MLDASRFFSKKYTHTHTHTYCSSNGTSTYSLERLENFDNDDTAVLHKSLTTNLNASKPSN